MISNPAGSAGLSLPALPPFSPPPSDASSFAALIRIRGGIRIRARRPDEPHEEVIDERKSAHLRGWGSLLVRLLRKLAVRFAEYLLIHSRYQV